MCVMCAPNVWCCWVLCMCASSGRHAGRMCMQRCREHAQVLIRDLYFSSMSEAQARQNHLQDRAAPKPFHPNCSRFFSRTWSRKG